MCVGLLAHATRYQGRRSLFGRCGSCRTKVLATMDQSFTSAVSANTNRNSLVPRPHPLFNVARKVGVAWGRGYIARYQSAIIVWLVIYYYTVRGLGVADPRTGRGVTCKHVVKGRHYYCAHTHIILTLILNNAQCACSPIALLVHVLYYSSVTSTLVAALEIWPPSKYRRAKLDHEIKCRRGEISRK